MQRLRLEVLYEYPTDPYVLIDELRVQQILINIIQNAIKFSGANDKIKIEVARDDSDESRYEYTIKVTD